MANSPPKRGDKVSWKSHGGEAHGKVIKKITQTARIKGHKAAASKGNPQFIVETNQGKRAAHKAGALSKE
ncbi:DUF2945 domain-containing protein [Sphingomonas sp.]|uniref:DUF2945 domain-containing protein n=1 Tax=Sphingomonas sp. TaxID=28214 RepID=UPI0025D65483|nr:DUF2945 domain-containing protein [Sphingomonas sp.]